MIRIISNLFSVSRTTGRISVTDDLIKFSSLRAENNIVQAAKMKMETELRDKTLASSSKDKETEMPEEIEEEAEEPATEPTGLMARRI